MTTSASRGIVREMSLRLCSRAPEMTSASDRGMPLSLWNRTDVPLSPPAIAGRFRSPRDREARRRPRAGSIRFTKPSCGYGSRAMRRFHLLAAAALVAVLASPAAAAQPSATKCPSPVPGERCFTIDVPLDHSGATPGTQRLGFALVPALGRRTGTLAVLVGGPGQSATSVARRLAALLTPVRRTQDLLLVDQRGTGLSGALRCPGLTQSGSPNALRTCGEQIGPRRAFYTAHEDALDLDDARSAAGIPQMSVPGISSGGRLAGVYARLFPDHVARLVLDSPEP